MYRLPFDGIYLSFINPPEQGDKRQVGKPRYKTYSSRQLIMIRTTRFVFFVVKPIKNSWKHV